MAYIDADGKTVKIPSVREKPPYNPLLPDYTRFPPPPSTTGSLKASQETDQNILEHELLLYDQCCLVTGAVSTQLQVYHLVNAIPMDESEKKQVEYILTRQQFGSGKFSLDSLPNCVVLEAQLRGDLDMYGSFCIVIPRQQLTMIIDTLLRSNRDWEVRAKSDPRAPRNLNIKQDPFVVRKCVLLVLRPDLFLPGNRPLPINIRRVLRNPDGRRVAETGRPSWVQFHLQHNRPYLADPNGREFTEFDYVSKRGPDQGLSIFSLLVNANSKLQGVKQRTNNTPHIKDYIELVEDAVKAIFFVPRELEKKVPPLGSGPVPPLLPGQDPSVTTSGLSTQSRGGRGDSEGQSKWRDHKDASVEEECSDPDVELEGSNYYGYYSGGDEEDDEPDPDVELENSDYCTDPDIELEGSNYHGSNCYSEENEEDDEPDTTNGLTFSQMESVLQRVSDGTISDQERVEAAMLMLGMAGAGPEYPQVLSPLIEYDA